MSTDEEDTRVLGLVVPLGHEPLRLVRIPTDYWTLRTIIGGSYLEAIEGAGWSAYVDEEGKLKQLPANFRATHIAYVLGWATGDVLVGPVVIVGPTAGDGSDTDVRQSILEVVAHCGYQWETDDN